MLEYKSELIGDFPQKLVVFLHGYNGNLEDHSEAINWLKKYMRNSLLCLPLAPEICDKNPNKRQWFGLVKHDGESRRYASETPVAEIMDIYNKTAEDIAGRAHEINELIDDLQKKSGINFKDTYVIGFSQGAMLALYVGLTAKKTYGGIVMLSGLVAAEKALRQQIKSYPDVYLFHGEKDKKVQYKTLEFTDSWLTENKIAHKIFIYPDLAHKIREDEILKAISIINQK